MDIRLHEVLKFPSDIDNDEGFAALLKYFGSVEYIEHAFGLEFSCGDGKFFGDFWQWSENKDALKAVVSCEEMKKYDGVASLATPARFYKTKELLKPDIYYSFVVRYYPKSEEAAYLLNGKQMNREWVPVD